jgi:Ca2+-binding EF-hand superfamily protein/methyl-accepting chemotaxis protein
VNEQQNKTPLQICANDRVRELILLYSDPDNDQIKQEKTRLELIKPTKEYNKESLKKSRDNVFDDYKPGVSGTRTDVSVKKTPKSTLKKKKPAVEETKAYYDELEELESKGILPFDLRNHRAKLIKLMRKVQEYGINHNLHQKKKFIFSGSWMEKIDDVSDIMASIYQTNSSETALKIFNVLYPYDKPLPAIDEEEDVIKEFYQEETKKKYDPTKGKVQEPTTFKESLAAKGMDNLMTKNKLGKEHQNIDPNFENYSEDGNFIANEKFSYLNDLLTATQQKLEEANKEKDELTKLLENRNQIIEVLNQKINSQSQGSTHLQEDNKKMKDHIKRLNLELDTTTNKLEEIKSQLQDSKKEYEKLVKDIPEIKELEAIRRAMENNEKQRQLDNQRNAALRFRAGLLFQQALEKSGKSEEKPGIKSKDPVKSGDYYLTDDGALIRFLNTVERNQPPSLYQRMLDADQAKTGSLTKSQFTKILKDLSMTPQDVMSLQRIAGFASGGKSIEIDEFVKIIKDRGKTRQRVENETSRKIQKLIKKEGWSVEECFEAFDTDKNGYIDYQEM